MNNKYFQQDWNFALYLAPEKLDPARVLSKAATPTKQLQHGTHESESWASEKDRLFPTIRLFLLFHL